MDYHPITLTTRARLVSQNSLDFTTAVLKEKGFASINKNVGKVKKFYPNPTVSQDKIIYKSKPKKI